MNKIVIKSKDPLVNVSYKVPPEIQDEIARIAESEQVSQGEIARALIEFGLAAYREGNVHRIWGERMMEHFRKQVRAGDEIIASGIFGTVRAVNPKDLEVEIADGVRIKIWKEELTDILNPRPEVLSEMKRFEATMLTPKVNRSA